jgi:hypothetical protein
MNKLFSLVILAAGIVAAFVVSILLVGFLMEVTDSSGGGTAAGPVFALLAAGWIGVWYAIRRRHGN